MAFRAPLLGYNTNVRHKGKLYHIQTEDSGQSHPHVMTHLFADGGRIVASRKTAYGEHIGADDLAATVKKLMQGQHKAMFIGLRDGEYDDSEEAVVQNAAAPEAAAAPAAPPAESLYQDTQAAQAEPQPEPALASNKPAASIFGGDLMSEKSLDEVILSYLASDDTEGEG